MRLFECFYFDNCGYIEDLIAQYNYYIDELLLSDYIFSSDDDYNCSSSILASLNSRGIKQYTLPCEVSSRYSADGNSATHWYQCQLASKKLSKSAYNVIYFDCAISEDNYTTVEGYTYYPGKLGCRYFNLLESD